MTDETDSVSEVARVLGEHQVDHIGDNYLVCRRCGGLAAGTTVTDHQGAVLAEAGLLRDQAALATAFESGARSYAAVDPCCGTYHLHEIQNPHTGEAIPRREGEDDL